MNYILLKLNSAPCIISADDRLAYFGALDAFHQEGGLAPFIDFCRIQTLNTWEHLLQVGPSQLLPLFLAKVAIVSTLGMRPTDRKGRSERKSPPKSNVNRVF